MMPELTNQRYQEILKAQQHEMIENQFIQQEEVNLYEELSDVLSGLNQFFLVSSFFSSEQNTHLTNLIEVTQNTKVQQGQVQYMQTMINKIDPKEMITTPSFNQLKQSDTQQHSFKCYVKRNPQQDKLDKSQTIQSNLSSLESSYHIIKTHCCPTPQVKAKYPVPKRYSQVQAHYSPKNLRLYLNKDHPEYSNNTKWLKQDYHQEERAQSADIQLVQSLNPIQQLRQSLLLQSQRIKNSQNLSRYQSIQEQFKQTFTAKLEEDEYTKNRTAARTQVSPPHQQQNQSSSRKQEQRYPPEESPRRESSQNKGRYSPPGRDSSQNEKKLKTLFANVDSNQSFKQLGQIVYDANDQNRVSNSDLQDIQQSVMRLSRKISMD